MTGALPKVFSYCDSSEAHWPAAYPSTRPSNEMKRVSTITALAIIGIIALIVYASPWTETDVVPKGSGEGEDLQAWIALGTGVLSLAASTIGLLMKLIELRERRRAKS